MATLKQKVRAERTLRELLESADLPMTDEIEYGYGCIRAIWWEQKRAVVIDLDDLAGVSDDDEDEDEPSARGERRELQEVAALEAAADIEAARGLDETLDLDELIDLADDEVGEHRPWAA